MTNPLIMTGVAILDAIAGGCLGYVIGKNKPRPQLTPEIVQKYMSRVVNIEQIEEHEKLVKVRMARNARKTVRTDGGSNARIMRMRLPKGRRR